MLRSFLAFIVLIAASSVAHAQAGWRVSQSIGDVQVETPGLQRIAVRPNDRLHEGATVSTGSTGRAILVGGRESIVLQPESRVVLPAGDSGNMTKIQQDYGTAVFKVGKEPQAHFEVETPYLAAVVKGTVFEVSVDALGASVSVSEGAVEVSALNGGETVLTRPGFVSRVDRARPHIVRMQRQASGAYGQTARAPGGRVVALLTEITPEDDAISPANDVNGFAIIEPPLSSSPAPQMALQKDALPSRETTYDGDRDSYHDGDDDSRDGGTSSGGGAIPSGGDGGTPVAASGGDSSKRGRRGRDRDRRERDNDGGRNHDRDQERDHDNDWSRDRDGGRDRDRTGSRVSQDGAGPRGERNGRRFRNGELSKKIDAWLRKRRARVTTWRF